MQAMLRATATSNAMAMAVTSARHLQVKPYASNDFEPHLPGIAGTRAANAHQNWHAACSNNLS